MPRWKASLFLKKESLAKGTALPGLRWIDLTANTAEAIIPGGSEKEMGRDEAAAGAWDWAEGLWESEEEEVIASLSQSQLAGGGLTIYPGGALAVSPR